VSGARPGTKSQLNESVDSQHLGAPENRIEVAIVKRMPHGRRTRTALRVSKHLTAYLTAYPGQSVTRQDTLWHKPSDRYVREACPGIP